MFARNDRSDGGEKKKTKIRLRHVLSHASVEARKK